MGRVIWMAVILVFVISSYACQPEDVKGWRGATWGMTEEELIEEFGEELFKLEERREVTDLYRYYADYYALAFSLEDVHYNAYFYMSPVTHNFGLGPPTATFSPHQKYVNSISYKIRYSFNLLRKLVVHPWIQLRSATVRSNRVSLKTSYGVK